jgi:hypothetical protein
MKCCVIPYLFLLSLSVVATETVYLQPNEFVAQHFSSVPQPQYFWLIEQYKTTVTDILGHKPDKIRIKYWGQGHKSVWILDEVGKEEPITVGIAIENNKIADLKVLIYRESRGHEVKQAFFTRQYLGLGLDPELDLEQPIDGITGATLSVAALNKMARVALYLHQQSSYSTTHEQKTASP